MEFTRSHGGVASSAQYEFLVRIDPIANASGSANDVPQANAAGDRLHESAPDDGFCSPERADESVSLVPFVLGELPIGAPLGWAPGQRCTRDKDDPARVRTYSGTVRPPYVYTIIWNVSKKNEKKQMLDSYLAFCERAGIVP